MTLTPRVIALLGIVGAIIAILLLANHWRLEARQARSERDDAVASAGMREAETKAVVEYHTKETVIREVAAPAIQSIEQAEGADVALPDPVIDAWRVGVVSLRDGQARPGNPDPIAAQ